MSKLTTLNGTTNGTADTYDTLSVASDTRKSVFVQNIHGTAVLTVGIDSGGDVDLFKVYPNSSQEISVRPGEFAMEINHEIKIKSSLTSTAFLAYEIS